MQRKTFLEILGPAPKQGKEPMVWCRCHCGMIKRIRKSHVTGGAIRSCGCLRRQAPQNITHGMSHLPEYRIFMGMKNRCENPHDHGNYSKYGAQGIRCFWTSFEEFYAALGPRPSRYHSLDRYPDPEGPYSPENTRWATPRMQALNRRHNRYLTLNDRTQTVSEWEKETGIHHTTILQRKRLGWTDEKALTVSPEIYKKR